MPNHDSKIDSPDFYAKAFKGLLSQANENGIKAGFRLNENSDNDVCRMELIFADKITGECEYVVAWEKD